jgi:hypothetical protein
VALIVTIYVPGGIVMAADSRLIMRRAEERDEAGKRVRVEQQLVFSDNANLVVRLRRVPMGVSLYDSGVIKNEPIDSHIYRFEAEVVEPDDDVDAVADKLMAYFKEHYPGENLGFHVCGYRIQGKASVPVVLVGHTVREPGVRRVNLNDEGSLQYGIVRSGDVLVVNRLIDPKYIPMFAAMPVQDAIDYAVHLIRTTIDTMRFEPRFPTVGGPVDVLLVRADGPLWIQRKELHGEGGAAPPLV